MGRIKLTALAAMFCLFTACTANDNSGLQTAMDFRAALLQTQACTFTAKVTANYNDRSYTFTIDCAYHTEGESTLTVTAPESIAGITATLSDGAGELSFDGTALDFGVLPSTELAPVAAPLLMANGWVSGYIDASGQEDGLWHTTYTVGAGSDAYQVDTWFTADGQPTYGEISQGETTALSLAISGYAA